MLSSSCDQQKRARDSRLHRHTFFWPQICIIFCVLRSRAHTKSFCSSCCVCCIENDPTFYICVMHVSIYIIYDYSFFESFDREIFCAALPSLWFALSPAHFNQNKRREKNWINYMRTHSSLNSIPNWLEIDLVFWLFLSYSIYLCVRSRQWVKKKSKEWSLHRNLASMVFFALFVFFKHSLIMTKFSSFTYLR